MDNLLENLNKEQAEAVAHKDGPLLIIAGAGTGKTTVVTRRIAYLVREKLARPDEILALTFTEKAAGEMQERADLLLPLGYYDQWICTFHAFGERILKAHALDIGIPNDFKLLDTIQRWIFVYKNLEKFRLNYYRPLGNPGRFIDALLTHFDRCKDELISPADYLAYAEDLRLKTDQPEKVEGRKKEEGRGEKVDKTSNPAPDPSEISRIEEIAGAFHVYQKLLLDNNYLDFGDLINFTLDLFGKRPKILEFYRNKFKYIMVDEFQDTNLAQYQLVKMLAGDRKNIVVVGDDDQSIYKFRGASVSNILKLKADYPELRQVALVENYRSSQNILDLAYNFIQANNPDRLEQQFKISKKLKANTADQDGEISVLQGEDLSEELDMVVKKILELKNSAADVSWNDFAILIRANSAAEDIVPRLAAQGMPYAFVANRGLYKKPIIADILSYLRLLDDFHDSAALYKVLTLPKFRVDAAELAGLLHHGHKKALSVYEVLQIAETIPGTSPEAVGGIRQLLAALAKDADLARRHSAAEVFVHAIRDIGIDEVIKADTLENAENRELIEQLYKKIEGFESAETDRSLKNFLQTLDLELQAGNDGVIKFDPNQGPESVKVMTIHSAKGLEFQNVFVVNMVDQRFPTREKNEPIEIPGPLIKDILPSGDFHLQEERRLFYVAMTRAKKRLFLSWTKDYGGARTKKPSLFLQETGLVPGERVSKATGKVAFGRPKKLEVLYQILPTRFSYSQLNDFETCPLKYKYRHYLKLPLPGSCHLSFGQTMHKVFESYLNRYKSQLQAPAADLFGQKPEAVLPDFKLLEELYEKEWVDDWYKDKKEKEEYRGLGRQMLQTFYRELSAVKPNPAYIEQSFKLKLGDYDFTGKIDRADRQPGGLVIFDYKTGKIPKSGKDIDQLYIYQWAAQDFLKEHVIGLKYWYLQDNQFVEEKIAADEQLNKLKSRLLELIEKIIRTTRHDLFAEEHKKAKDHRCEFEGMK